MKSWSIIVLALSAIVVTPGARAGTGWQSTTEYVDELQASTTDDVCIAIAAGPGADQASALTLYQNGVHEAPRIAE